MNLTAQKFWDGERARLQERRKELLDESEKLNARLTEITKEGALLDDVIGRLDAHLPDAVAVAAPADTQVVPIRKAEGGGG